MTGRGALIAALLWGCWAAAPAAALADCPATAAAPEIVVRIERGTVTVASGLPDDGARDGEQRFADAGRAVGGVTHTTFHSGMRVEVAIRRLDAHRFCATPTKVDLDIGFPQFAVTIDQRYVPGTCEHRALLDHESTHVAILRDTLDRFAPRVKARLAEAAAGFRPVVVGGDEDAADAVMARLQRDIDPVIGDLRAAAAAASSAIDTEQSYAAVAARCGNW